LAKDDESHSSHVTSQTAFGGIRTFSRLPTLFSDEDGEVDLAVLGIPFDSLVTFRPGARLGPNAIRQASGLCRNYSQQIEVGVFDRLHAFDAGDLAVNPFDYKEAFKQIENGIRHLHRRGAAVVALGGDHSILLPILRATSEKYPGLTLIQFDAHADTSDESASGQRFHHGTSVRRAIDEGLVDGSNSRLYRKCGV
jgi:agmatinase